MSSKTGVSSLDIAKHVAGILRKVLSHVKGRDANIQNMMLQVKEACRLMKEAYPYGPLVANVTRRVLYILRDEYQITMKESQTRNAAAEEEDSGTPNSSFIQQGNSQVYNPVLDSQIATHPALEDAEQTVSYSDFKNNVMEHLTNNFMHDFDDVHKHISQQAPDHISEGEVILTYGSSQTVEKFLLFAAKKQKFQVIICEAAPECNGHELAVKLQGHDIDTTLIPDTLAHAYMARVSKVLLGTFLVVANGGLVAPAGTHGVAVAAQVHRVPVIVLTAMIKLTPVYPSTTDMGEFGRLRNPAEVMPLSSVLSAVCDPDAAPSNWVQVLSSSVDYVPPEQIALFVTNDDAGRAYAPYYVYRLLHQLYNPEDSTL
eukprot:TRINITY_DN7028_c0_g1_i1.p1 TRINITY_DN7028_c0_g1~~TRINITY_DN7028_c0_g1_i1.p1  ORF type:complete len:421 (+),score=123.92 TRINITY_DN7028_c0_g1_i1:149-1264(+)